MKDHHQQLMLFLETEEKLNNPQWPKAHVLSLKASRAVQFMLDRGDCLESLIDDRMIFLAERAGWKDATDTAPV